MVKHTLKILLKRVKCIKGLQKNQMQRTNQKSTKKHGFQTVPTGIFSLKKLSTRVSCKPCKRLVNVSNKLKTSITKQFWKRGKEKGLLKVTKRV